MESGSGEVEPRQKDLEPSNAEQAMKEKQQQQQLQNTQATTEGPSHPRKSPAKFERVITKVSCFNGQASTWSNYIISHI
jgi:hypothetical protein